MEPWIIERKLEAHPGDKSMILPTESRQLHAQGEYFGVHNSNSRIMPALSAFLLVCTNTHLTDAISAS